MKSINRTITSYEVTYGVYEVENGSLVEKRKNTINLSEKDPKKILKIIQSKEKDMDYEPVIVVISTIEKTNKYSMSIEDFILHATEIEEMPVFDTIEPLPF